MNTLRTRAPHPRSPHLRAPVLHAPRAAWPVSLLALLALTACAPGERSDTADTNGVRSFSQQRAASQTPASANPDRSGASSGPGSKGTSSALAAATSEPWAFEGKPGRLIRTTHFNLFTTEDSDAIMGRLPHFVETAIEHYRTSMGTLPEPGGRMDTYVMGTRAQWHRLTLMHMGERGRQLANVPRGGFAYNGRAYFFDIGASDTLSIAAHEGWHQYTQSTFAERLPLWAEEGMATFMEGHRWSGSSVTFVPWSNLERFDKLREAHARGELRPLEELLSASTDGVLAQGSESAVIIYAQWWALIHFLNEGEGGKYRPALRRLVRDAASGQMGSAVVLSTRRRTGDARSTGLLLARQLGVQVFRAYIGPELSSVDAEYRAFIASIVGTGARQAVVEGRSPRSDPGSGARRSDESAAPRPSTR